MLEVKKPWFFVEVFLRSWSLEVKKPWFFVEVFLRSWSLEVKKPAGGFFLNVYSKQKIYKV
jgi:hypothetical protein